jgi:hypothetical protein
MLRSFTVIDPHLVNLIRENPRYTKMTPEEILGKFVSGRMMVKEACHTRVLGVQNPGANIITRCARTKSHTYDESWHRIECHIFTI